MIITLIIAVLQWEFQLWRRSHQLSVMALDDGRTIVFYVFLHDGLCLLLCFIELGAMSN